MSKNDNFGEQVRAARERLALSQEQLAKEMGYSRNYISMIEGGRDPGRSFVREWLSFEQARGLRAPEATPRLRLKAAREAGGLTIAQFARRLGYGAGVLEAVENGTARASERMIEAICRELPALSKEELMAGSDYPSVLHQGGIEGTYGATPNLRVPPGSKARYVPLLSWAQAGALDAGHMDEGYDYKGVISIDIKDPRAFAVEIRGNSMEPRIAEGDKAIVCPGNEPRAGDTVIARTLEGDVMCKLYQARDGGQVVILSSWNPAFPPVELRREEIAWIYPVRQVVQEYGRE